MEPRNGLRRATTVLGLLLAAVGLGVEAAAFVVEGRVYVRDGDTIVVDGTPVRLQALHAPELNETGGREARAFVQGLVADRDVRCELTGETTYDRQVGRCYVDGQDVAALLVRAGLGRACPRFGPFYVHLEDQRHRTMPLPGYCRPR